MMHAAVVSLVIREILSFSTEMLNFINIQFVMAVAMLHGAETIETDVGDELGKFSSKCFHTSVKRNQAGE
ncbi:hypothetical protein Y032_0026g1351 [Ancylostoma ceylanicum]|uniref:Uncharacterized protein n=1 Tax=Ancylostoma ceylanicum TaxID=53326 RepID=A0A016UTJ8_9BILA|nr:hypothetical protein Y032_0026g1351 [Ancylostoma ceylanicum]